MMGDCKVECCDQYHEDEDEDANDEEDEDEDGRIRKTRMMRRMKRSMTSGMRIRMKMTTLQGPKTHPFQERLI